MESNPVPPPPASPRTSRAAVCSLVLGILSIPCFSVITGIPAIICGHVAHGKIKRSGGALTGAGMAIAGFITGYVSLLLAVFVIPMMLAIAVPNFVKAREVAMRNVCLSNLHQINGAMQSWALDNNKPADAVVTLQDLSPYLKTPLVCPAGGTYRLGKVSEPPTCSIPGHALPNPKSE